MRRMVERFEALLGHVQASWCRSVAASPISISSMEREVPAAAILSSVSGERGRR